MDASILTDLAHDPFVQTGVLATAGALVTHVLLRRYPAGRLIFQFAFFAGLTALLSRHAGRLEGTAKPTIISRDDDAVAQGRSQSRLLLDVHDVCHAARGGAAAAENRMLLSANTATAAKVRELAASTG